MDPTEKENLKEKRELEKGLQDVGENLPDDVEGVEGSDVGHIERHHREASSKR